MADVTIDRLEIEIAANSLDASVHITQLTGALRRLKEVTKGGAGLSSVNTALKNMVNNFGALNMNSAAFERLRQRIEEMNEPVEKLGAGFDNLANCAKDIEQVGTATKQTGSAAKQAASDTKNFATMLKDISVSAVALYHGIKKAVSTFQSVVSSASDYTEDMNLFSVSMGQYAARAKEYADEVNSALGIDTGDWMRAQGVFMQLATGFGVAGDQAEYMSRNLTQISYDLASFFNLDPEEAVNKVRSGLSGELEPLRNLGYALDRNTLQELARARGIDKSVDAMSQAEKAQLRYIAILTQNQNVMGDMSRTIEAPANAMRVLEQQVKQLGRAVGNVLIPWLQAVIPVVQAVVTVLTEFVNMLAQLVGFELPEISSTPVDDVATGATDAEEALSGAAGAATELKNALLGIDELNVISPNSGGGGGAGAATGTDAFFGELPGYDDFINNISDKTKALTDELRARMKPFFDFVESHFDEIKRAIKIIGPMLAALSVVGLVSSLGDSMAKLDKLSKMLAVAVEIAVQFVLNKWTMDSYLDSGSWLALLGNVLTTGLGSLLLYKTLGPKGIVIGAAVSVVANAVSIGLSIADGSVDVDDPKTWIASIVSVLIGTAGGTIGLIKGGMMADTALGISFGLSAMITLAAIQYGGIASGSFDTNEWKSAVTSIGTILAGAFAGTLIGFAIGGAAGALPGFVIGATVGLVVTIGSIVAGSSAKAKAAFEESDIHAQYEEIREWASEEMELVKQVKVRIETRYEDFEQITSDFASIRDAVETLFDLNDLPIKSDAVKKLMGVYAGIINGAAGEIIIHYDGVSGAVAETRDEINKYIQSLEDQARAEAAYDLLVDALKEQIALNKELDTTIGKQTDAYKSNRIAAINLSKAVAEKNKYEEEGGSMYHEMSLVMQALDPEYRQLIENVKTAQLSYDESNESLGTATEATNALRQQYKDCGEQVDYFSGIVNDFGKSLPDTTNAVDDMSESVNGAFDGTAAQWGPSTDAAIDAVMLALDNGEIDLGEALSQIKSIAMNALGDELPDKWYESGQYLMKGFADGIESEIQSVNRVVKDVASGVTKTLNQTLEINSPSRKWMESGYWLDAGLAMGIEQNAASVMDTVGDLAGNLETGIDPNGWYSNNWQPTANYRNGTYVMSVDWREFIEQLTEAMTQVMEERSTDDEKSVYVYLDGKQISSVNEKWQRNRGAAIFGTGVRP